MQATAEKPTCKYSLRADGYIYTQCGQVGFPDDTKKDKYCRHCGKAIERIERE